MRTEKAICGACGHYGQCKCNPSITKGNPWRCTATRQCQKRAHG